MRRREFLSLVRQRRRAARAARPAETADHRVPGREHRGEEKAPQKCGAFHLGRDNQQRRMRRITTVPSGMRRRIMVVRQ